MPQLLRRGCGLLVAHAESDEERRRDGYRDGEGRGKREAPSEAAVVRLSGGCHLRVDGRMEVGEDGVELGWGLRRHQEPFKEARSAESAR